MARTIFSALCIAGVLFTGAGALGNEAADSDAKCPDSPPGALVWKPSRGPDFWVCSGTPPGATHPVVGVYYGWAANFHFSAPGARETGFVEGMPIEWQVSTTDSGQLKRETIFVLKTRPGNTAMQVHIWIIADDKTELESTKQLVRRISF
jgi:hypothetical protein